MARLLDVFRQFLLLGCSSFGGPVAHLGYFRERFVKRENWLSDDAYADLIALAGLLPGPSSSQVGIGIGLMRAGWWGGFAWLGHPWQVRLSSRPARARFQCWLAITPPIRPEENHAPL